MNELENLNVLRTERLESMSPRGSLALIKEDDGDIVLAVSVIDHRNLFASLAVEFCTPGAGGGGSPRTHAALIQLAAAMAADNLDSMQQGRRPPGINDEDQRTLVECGRRVLEADKEMKEFEKLREQGFEDDKLSAAWHLAKGSYGTAKNNGLILEPSDVAFSDEFKQLAANFLRIAELLCEAGFKP